MTQEGNLTFDRLDPRAARPAPEMFAGARKVFAALGALGAAGCVAGYLVDPRQFYFSYLTAFLCCITIPLGMLFFVMLHHVVDAGWSVVVRRSAEQVLAALPVLALLFLPVLAGLFQGRIFNWTAFASHGEHDELLASKRPYLNVTFFLIRLAIYFAAWNLLAWKLRGNSIRQDHDGAARHTFSSRRFSAPGFFVYALTFTFAAFDWIMSLDYHWFSTVFGVYVWSGSVVSSLAVLILITLALARGPLAGLVSSDHLHDLGKLLFAFCVFWAYIAFSQYFLIWYSNIPEETVWFMHRWTGAQPDQLAAQWWIVSIILPVGHFVLPFLVLMSAAAKRNPKVLAAMCAILLATHYVDAYWMIMPTLHEHGPHLKALWIDLSALLAIGGAAAWVVTRAMTGAALYPLRDPRLQESLMAEHVEEVTAADVE